MINTVLMLVLIALTIALIVEMYFNTFERFHDDDSY